MVHGVLLCVCEAQVEGASLVMIHGADLTVGLLFPPIATKGDADRMDSLTHTLSTDQAIVLITLCLFTCTYHNHPLIIVS